jgi:hypothetical protein
MLPKLVADAGTETGDRQTTIGPVRYINQAVETVSLAFRAESDGPVQQLTQ